MSALFSGTRAPVNAAAPRGAGATALLPLYRQASGGGLHAFVDTARAPVLGVPDVVCHASTKYAYPSSYTAGATPGFLEVPCVGGIQAPRSAGSCVVSTPSFRCYAIGNNVRVLNQEDPNVRGLLRLHEAAVHDVAAHPDARVPVFASADVSGAWSSSRGRRKRPRPTCASPSSTAGRVLVVRVARSAIDAAALELAVIADLRPPQFPGSGGGDGGSGPTLLRWHPSLPAQLLVARGARVFLVDLAGTWQANRGRRRRCCCLVGPRGSG